MKRFCEAKESTLQTNPSLSKPKRSTSQTTSNSKCSSSHSSASTRSKYLCGNRLTRSRLFESLQGWKGSLKEGQEEQSLEMELLQDTLGMAFRQE